MKLCLISTLVPILMFSGGAGAAEIYNTDGNKLDLNGKIVGVHYFDNNNTDSDHSYMRFGFLGEMQITPQLTGYGRWEYQAELDQGEKDASEEASTLLGFVGLKFADLGSFDYGRNYGVLYDVLAWTDRLPEFGGDAFGADNYMSHRGNNLATYRNTGFFGQVDGLNFAVQYQGENQAGDKKGVGRGIEAANGNGYGMAVSYDLGWGISAIGALTSASRPDKQKDHLYGQGGNKANAYAGALKYDARNYYLAAMYSQSYNLLRFGDVKDDKKISGFANKAQTFEAVAQYLFDFGFSPSLAYVQTRGCGIEKYNKQNLRKYFDIGATYNFNDNMATYIDYKINMLKGNDFTEKAGIKRDNIVATGLQYRF